jgi:hypothetical protein
MLGTKSDRCLMIGNDVEMDMAAKYCEIPTFYLQTMPDKPKVAVELADFSGDFNDLADVLSIPNI